MINHYFLSSRKTRHDSIIDLNGKKELASVERTTKRMAVVHRPQRFVSFLVPSLPLSFSFSFSLARSLPKKNRKHPTEDREREREREKGKKTCRMLKKRSLVVNLTHEITGTDVADKRIRLHFIRQRKDLRWIVWTSSRWFVSVLF